jgi:hypothetical protein
MRQEKRCLRFSGICLRLLTVSLLATHIGCATTAKTKWDKPEKAMLASYAALHVIDYGQTVAALEDGYVEGNPMFGKHPSRGKIILIKALVCGGTIYAAHKWKDQRKVLLAFGIVWGVTAVTHNYFVIGGAWRF